MYNKRSLSKDTKASKAPKSISKPRDIIVDPMGQWKHPGQNTRIPSSDITMKGVPYPVLGVGSNGQEQMMYPGQEYQFPGAAYVDEYPQMRKGGGLKSKKYSRDLEALSATHVESPLFKKKKSKKKKIFHPKAKYYQEGGMTTQEEIDAANNAMMKARLAYANMHGNTAAQRMIVAPDEPYQYTGNEYDQLWGQPVGAEPGMIGTHYMSSFGNYAVPFIQQGSNGLYFNEAPSVEDSEAIRFDNEDDAQYFGEHYKDIAPDASYRGEYQEGGANLTPEEEAIFQKFYSTLPDNLMSDDPTYNMRGYWDSEGRPEGFDYSQPTEDDGYYHAYSINGNTGEYLKSPAHETFQHAVDEDRKMGYRPVTDIYGRNIVTENESIATPAPTHFLNDTTGPANYIETELTPEEIQQYRDGGYIVEELNDYKAGGALLTKKVTCKNCGWKWDAADGGNDLTTCHKCGGKGLVHAQKGGSQVYTYADRPEAKYKKDDKGNWLISLPSTKGKYVPIKDPSGKRAGELNEKAKPVKPPQWQQDKKKYGKDKVEWYESYNPNDWFLNDYSKYSSYNSAFRNARESGEDEFIYKGERYNTKLIDKKHSDRYWDSKKFVEEYYKNQPLTESDLQELKDAYIQKKHGTTWYDYYNNVVMNDPINKDYNKWNKTRYQEMQDSLDMLDTYKLPDDDPDFLKFANKNKYKTQLNALKKPTYFSITDYKPSDMSEDGYWDAMKNKMFMTTKADPGQLNTTFVHELSHKADDYDIYRKVPEHNTKEWQKTSWAEGWDQDKYDYISNPTEIEARKLSTLYWFKEHGWPYQPGKIREEGLDRLYDAKLNDKIPYDIDQLLDFYGNQYDDLLRYLNSDYTEKRELGGSIGDEVDLTPEQEAHLRRLGYKLERI